MKLMLAILSLKHLENSRGTVKPSLPRITGVVSSKCMVAHGTLLSELSIYYYLTEPHLVASDEFQVLK